MILLLLVIALKILLPVQYRRRVSLSLAYRGGITATRRGGRSNREPLRRSVRKSTLETQVIGAMGFFHELLLTACREGDVDAARRRLRRGMDVDKRSGIIINETALTAATSEDQVKMVKFLLDEAGANVNGAARFGVTALHCAKSEEMATLLTSKGANIEAVTRFGQKPLDRACLQLYEGVVVVLLQRRAAVTSRDSNPIATTILTTVNNLDKLGVGTRILRELVRYGAEWDPSCEATLGHTDGILTDSEQQLWQRVVPAIRFLVSKWIEERRIGRELSKVPEDVINKGLRATKTFVKELHASRRIVCRRTISVVGPSTGGKTSLIKSLLENDSFLANPEDRTVGIDLFTLRFDEPPQSVLSRPRVHEVRFSDFAGQDVYQVMHSLFFTKKTLFLVSIDLNAYSIALLKCEMLTKDDAKLQHMMNEYVDHSVLSYIRVIIARQPDAEFAFICTKEDMISVGPGVDKDEVLNHAKMMLARVMVIVQSVKPPANTGEVRQPSKRVKPITHLWDPRLPKWHKHVIKIIVTSSATTESARYIRGEIERLIIESEESYETPDVYIQVRDILNQMKEAAAALPIDARVQAMFKDVGELVQEIRQVVPGMDELMTKDILRSLRDRVDILWYEDMEDKKLQTTVILDPTMLIELVRQVINHKHLTGIMYHAKLSALDYWRDLTGDVKAMRSMKILLQKFRLVYPAAGLMEFGSDLIVPTYWKTNPHAVWIFGGEKLRLHRREEDGDKRARTVHWEFRFTYFIPDTLFDHLVVASYSPSQPLEVGPDWILYRQGELAACRIVVSRHWETHERSLHLEAVVADATKIDSSEEAKMWAVFRDMCEALGRVLKEHPGLSVTSFARSDMNGHEPSLSCMSANKGTMADQNWMPPVQVSRECLRHLVKK